MSFKDKHALETLPERISELGQEVARLNSVLADPDLYAKHPARFAATTKALNAAQVLLTEAEEQWLALEMPLQWSKGFPTRPEMEQGKGGSIPLDFQQDLRSLLSTLDRFCDALPRPCVPHPIFREMTPGDWMRWGYLHADHHLRQFGR